MYSIYKHIKNKQPIEIVQNINTEELYPPPPPILRRSPRGVDCGVTNPPYETKIQLKNEVEVYENDKIVKKWYFTDLSDEKKNMTWWMCPTTFNITWEATHMINESIFYIDYYNLDFIIDI